MRRTLVLLVIAVFLIIAYKSSTASCMDIYTFKKDRVDQEIKGNQGYLSGTPPAVRSPRKTQRTLIGIDIELPGTSSGGDDDEEFDHQKTENADVAETREVQTLETIVEDVAPDEDTAPKTAEDEEDWIK